MIENYYKIKRLLVNPRFWKLFLPFAILVFLTLALFYNLRAVSGPPRTEVLEIKTGDSFRSIVDNLSAAGLLRSPLTFKFISLLTGQAFKLKPGVYKLSTDFSSLKILRILVAGINREIRVVIPNDGSVYEIDRLLAAAGVIRADELINFSKNHDIEGRLYPDTYNFLLGSSAKEIVDEFLSNFDAKAADVLNEDPDNFQKNLILASLLEKEVPLFGDQRLVAGILNRRLAMGIPLQLDATICYIKKNINPDSKNCYPLTPLDLKLESPYNTYLHLGLPPGPIGSPSVSAIRAAMSPIRSNYLFYLSDPSSGKTIYSATLDNHHLNTDLYLRK